MAAKAEEGVSAAKVEEGASAAVEGVSEPEQGATEIGLLGYEARTCAGKMRERHRAMGSGFFSLPTRCAISRERWDPCLAERHQAGLFGSAPLILAWSGSAGALSKAP